MVALRQDAVAPPDLRSPEERALLAMFREADASQVRFNEVIEHEVARVSRALVLPLIRSVWPGLDDAAFKAKLDACIAPYTNLALSVLVCSRRRPRSFRLLSRIARAVDLDERRIARLASPLVPFLFRVLERRRVERAALGAALIIVFDEALDDGMLHVPVAERPRALCDVLEGKRAPTSEPLAAVAAVGAAMRARIFDADDEKALHRVVELFALWAESERQNLAGEADPLGYCHRRPAMIASMEVLAWGIAPYAGDKEVAWMTTCAEFAQMVDDLLDLEKDERQGRRTPAHEGTWSVETTIQGFRAAEAELVALQRESGEPDGPYLRLVVETFRAQCRVSAEILAANP